MVSSMQNLGATKKFFDVRVKDPDTMATYGDMDRGNEFFRAAWLVEPKCKGF